VDAAARMKGRYGLYRRVPRWDIWVEALRNAGFSAANGGSAAWQGWATFMPAACRINVGGHRLHSPDAATELASILRR
jgi:hypothetical protein